MSEEKLRGELYASFKNRAMMYYHIYKAMEGELGRDRAAEIIKQAIYSRGVEIGQQFQSIEKTNMEGLKEAFLGIIPDGGAMFAPEVQRSDGGGVDIKFHRCPLKEAWLDAGIPEDEVGLLCHIAGRVDNGTFEGAGFNFHAETWEPGRDGCCHLHLRPGG